MLTRPHPSLGMYLKLMLDGARRDVFFSTVATDKGVHATTVHNPSHMIQLIGSLEDGMRED